MRFNKGDGDIKEIVREFIVSNFLKGDDLRTLDDDESFLENALIDSVGVLELVAFIEVTFGVRVEDEEMIPANLDSVNKLISYVRSKLTSKH